MMSLQVFLIIIAVLLFSNRITCTSTGSIDDVHHIVIFMQENRPMDHYFGTLFGIRGFNDRTTIPLKNKYNAFYQPINTTTNNNSNDYMLPYRVDANQSNCMCMPAPEMYYPTDIKIWNSGRMDQWNTARDPGYGMSYFTRSDLPYYYKLYDHFLVGDQYFQSTFTCTNPNRMHLFTGSNGLSVGHDAVLENDEPKPGFNWTTVAELLEAKNISWKVYQQYDNFDDNAFAWFANFQNSRPGDALYDKGLHRSPNVIDDFKYDVKMKRLPQVSWIVAPTERSEHATNHPAAGEDFTAQLLKALEDNPDVYKNTVFILNYDEGGQFFDHAWTPTIPLNDDDGISTVSTDGEINTNVLTEGPNPIGLGFRVPLLIVSPWTRGPLVFSQVLDHTSIIQFLEKKYDFECPNISPWRREVTGDLLAAFDFTTPDYSWPSDLPDTSSYVRAAWIECETLPDPIIPEIQMMPKQELGTRRSRALPYEFVVTDKVSSSSLSSSSSLELSIDNTGNKGAAFVAIDVINIDDVNPLKYTVSSKSTITSVLKVSNITGDYNFHIQGPNGFVRNFIGNTNSDECLDVESYMSYQPSSSSVVLKIINSRKNDVKISIIDNAYNIFDDVVVLVPAGTQTDELFNVQDSGNWYDISISILTNNESSCYTRRFMGRMETGHDSISDPAMSQGIPGLWSTKLDGDHPILPISSRTMSRVRSSTKFGKDGECNDVTMCDNVDIVNHIN